MTIATARVYLLKYQDSDANLLQCQEYHMLCYLPLRPVEHGRDERSGPVRTSLLNYRSGCAVYTHGLSIAYA